MANFFNFIPSYVILNNSRISGSFFGFSYSDYLRTNIGLVASEDTFNAFRIEDILGIVKIKIWDSLSLDNIPSQSVANALMVASLKTDAGTVISDIQTLLGIDLDVQFGNNSINAIKIQNPYILFRIICKNADFDYLYFIDYKVPIELVKDPMLSLTTEIVYPDPVDNINHKAYYKRIGFYQAEDITALAI